MLFYHEAAFLAAMGRYGWSEDARFCPLDRFARQDVMGEFTRHLNSSYHLSLDVRHLGVNRDGARTFSPSQVADPAGTPLLHDITRLEHDPEEASKRVRLTSHGERFNVVFMDGHTKLMPNP